MQSVKEEPIFNRKYLIPQLFLIVILVAAVTGVPVHALGETYHLTQSATRMQETNSPGITFTLNVTGATTSLNYQFSWLVRDPNGGTKSINTQVTSVPATFVTSVNYPTDFGVTVTFVGNYTLTVTQTMPPSSTTAGTAQFTVGLTNALSYQRTDPVSLVAQGYQNLENISIAVRSGSGSAPGFPTTTLASPTGVLTFTWASIPPNVALGKYIVTLTGSKTNKAVLDNQSFMITSANLRIPQLTVSQNSVERTQVENFRFTATYPNSSQVKTGSALIRITEADGTTVHNVTATYKSSLGLFEASYRIPINSTAGAWVAAVDIGGFNDGYGNMGPTSGVVRGFAVAPATLTVVVTTGQSGYTLNNVVVLYASVITPGGANFTSGTVTAESTLSSRPIGNPIQLFYDGSRGKWVGGYTINQTNPSGVWLIQINATDQYNNFGTGSTSMLVTVPPQQPPQQPPQTSPTSEYLLVLVGVLAGILAILGSWIAFRRGRVARKVLRVDLEAVHAEADKIGDQEFFKHVQEQLKDKRNATTKEPDQKKENGALS